MRASPNLVAINAGEFSPRMHSRVDFSRYPAGAETLLNCLIDERGGIYRRPGTYYAATAKNSATAESKIIGIAPTQSDAYVLELFAGGFRFFRDQGPISVVSVSTAIANGTFATDLTSWTDVDTGVGVSVHSTLHGGSMSLNATGTANADIAAREQTVTVAAGDQAKVHVLKFQVIGDYGPISLTQSEPSAVATTTVTGGAGGEWMTLRIGTASGGEQLLADTNFGNGYHTVSFTPNAGTIYIRFQHRWRAKAIYVDNVSFHASGALELTNSYVQGNLDNVRWAAAGDLTYFTHTSYHPYILKRRGDRSWSWEQAPIRQGPFEDENVNSTLTITLGAATGFAVTCTATLGIFKSTDVGRHIRFPVSASPDLGGKSWGIIVGYTSATVVTVDIMRDSIVGAQTKFSLGSWAATTGFPKHVEFFKQRAFYANNGAQPSTIWGSQSADIDNMYPESAANPGITIQDDDAVVYKLVERQVNEIVGLSVARDLIVLTTGSEIPVSSIGAAITPTDVQASPQTSYGSNGTPPLKINSVTLFAQRGGRRILRMGFDVRIEGYAAEDMTILSEHITRSGVVKLAHQQEPNSIIWCLLDNGTLASLTFHPEQQVAGWARHEIGGKFNGRNAVVDDIAVIPGADTSGTNERDELWMIVKRTINGATARYIEFMEADFDSEDPVEIAVYADSALTSDLWNTDTAKTLELQGTTLSTTGDPESDELTYDDAWRAGDSVTLEATGHTPFVAGDVDQVWLLFYKGEILGVEIDAVTDSNTATVTLQQDAPRDFRNAPITRWLDPSVKTAAISGLTHLEAQTVKVLGDGAVLDDKTVSSAAITASESSGAFVVGLGYESQYKSLKLDAGAQLGTAIGRPRRTGDITLSIFAATGFRIGPTMNIADMQEVETRERHDPIGLRAKLWEGEYPIPTGGPWSKDPRICLKSSDPRPFFILAAMPEINTNEVL